MDFLRPIILSLVFIGALGFFSKAGAQNSREQMLHQRLDSLIQVHADTAIVQTYFDLAHYYLRQDSSKTALYAHRTLQVADSIDSKLGRGIGNMALGLHHIIQGNYRQGLIHSFDAESIFKEISRDDYLAMLNSYIGIAYSRMGNNNKALQYYLVSDSLMKRTGTPMQQAQIKANISIIYSSQGHYNSTIKYFKEAMPIFKQHGAPPHVALVYHNIGVAYRHLSAYDSSLVYLNKAFELRKDSNDRFGLASTLQNLGKVYGELKQYELALDYLNRAIELQKELGDQGILLRSYLDASVMYKNLALMQQARYYANNALEIANRIGDLSHQAAASVFLSEIEEQSGANIKALNYLKLYRKLQDSLMEQNRAEAFEEMRARYETQEMEQQIEFLQQEQALSEAKIARARILRNSLIGGFLALTVILVLLYLRYRSGKQYQAELQQKNRKLEDLSEEKSEYLHIAAHDLKSPLSSILGLAELMKDSPAIDEETRTHAEFIFISAFRMHDMIKQFLDVNAIESGNKMANNRNVDLTDTIRQVVKHFRYQAQWKEIGINFEFDEKQFPAFADPVLFREVLDNIVSNAVKYSPKDSQIWIKAENLNDSVKVEVRDEGPGITKEEQKDLFQKFKRLTPEPTQGEGSTGLGLYIAKKMTVAMNGSIRCESDGNNGSTFIVELPKYDN